jgi:hypothetical protein
MLKCINLCLGESESYFPSHRDSYLPLVASPVVSNKNIQSSNLSSPIKERKKRESGSPPRLEGQYGCIDLVEIHPSIGQLSRLFVLEREQRRYHSLDRFSAYLRSLDNVEIITGLHGSCHSSQDMVFKGHLEESQVTLDYKSADKSFTGKKEDGSRTTVQIIIPGLEIPRWLTYQSLGNSVRIELPPNWFSRKWMGLALCASFNAISSPSYAHEFGNPVKTFGLRARVMIFRRYYSHPHFEIFFNVKVAPKHIWLLYLSRDDWLATVDGEYSKIEVVFETYSVNVWKCGAGLLYEQDIEEFHKTCAQCGGSNIITYEGWDGVHYEFENSLDHCSKDFAKVDGSLSNQSLFESRFHRDKLKIS